MSDYHYNASIKKNKEKKWKCCTVSLRKNKGKAFACPQFNAFSIYYKCNVFCSRISKICILDELVILNWLYSRCDRNHWCKFNLLVNSLKFSYAYFLKPTYCLFMAASKSRRIKPLTQALNTHKSHQTHYYFCWTSLLVN